MRRGRQQMKCTQGTHSASTTRERSTAWSYEYSSLRSDMRNHCRDMFADSAERGARIRGPRSVSLSSGLERRRPSGFGRSALARADARLRASGCRRGWEPSVVQCRAGRRQGRMGGIAVDPHGERSQTRREVRRGDAAGVARVPGLKGTRARTLAAPKEQRERHSKKAHQGGHSRRRHIAVYRRSAANAKDRRDAMSGTIDGRMTCGGSPTHRRMFPTLSPKPSTPRDQS